MIPTQNSSTRLVLEKNKQLCPIISKTNTSAMVLIAPILSETTPAQILPPVLNSAKVDTINAAFATVICIILCAIMDACEVIMVIGPTEFAVVNMIARLVISVPVISDRCIAIGFANTLHAYTEPIHRFVRQDKVSINYLFLSKFMQYSYFT